MSVDDPIPATTPVPKLATAHELRALYRAAEARAARLRVLADVSKALSNSRPRDLDATVARIAMQAAHLAGYARGRIAPAGALPNMSDDSLWLPLSAPGSEGDTNGHLLLEERLGTTALEDRESLGILAQLIGSALSVRTREQRLATLLGELLRSQEIERSRVAHDLHDGVAQSAAALMRRLELAGDGDPADLAVAIDQARALVIELRRVIGGMRPAALDDLGLGPALRQLADEAVDEIDVTLDIDLPGRPDPTIETALFRIVQEGLNNARAHAGPGTRVMVRLMREDALWRLSVSDNGCGFAPGLREPVDGTDGRRAGRGLGLAYMRERIELLGGRFEVDSAPGDGCRLRVDLPER